MRIQDILFRSGDLFLPKSLLRFLEYYYVGSDTSLLYVSNWTLVHVLTGVVLALYFIRSMSKKATLWRIFWIHSAWELWQILGQNTPIYTLRGILDVLVDTSATMIGAWFTLKVLEYK
jgi:hypothetical protein